MVDYPSFLFKFSSDVPISVTAEFLCERDFNFLNDDCIVKKLTILVYSASTWFYTASATTWLIIVRTGRKRCPFQQLANRNTFAYKSSYNPFSLFS